MKKIRKILLVVFVAILGVIALALTACSTRSDDSTHTHSYASTWSYDEEYHWHKAICEHIAETSGKSKHTFNSDRCTVCDYVKGSTIEPTTPTQFSIVFDANGGTFDSTKDTYTITLNSGALLSTIEDPQRDGYKFSGWYTSASLKDLWDFEKDTVTKSITLYG